MVAIGLAIAVVLIFFIIFLFGALVGWWVGKEYELGGDQVVAKGQGDLIQGEAVARQIWGPVCSGEDVDTTFAPLEGNQAGLAQSLISAGNVRFRCHVTIDNSKAYKKAKLCAIVVHEYGHLDGKDHSNDPNDVMYPTITNKNIPQGCKVK